MFYSSAVKEIPARGQPEKELFWLTGRKLPDRGEYQPCHPPEISLVQ
jgi:hypothetical protein